MQFNKLKPVDAGTMLKVTQITKEGTKEAEQASYTSGYNRSTYRQEGFIGVVTASYDYCIFLNTKTGRSSHTNVAEPALPSSFFMYEEVEYATKEDIEDLMETGVTKWLR